MPDAPSLARILGQHLEPLGLSIDLHVMSEHLEGATAQQRLSNECQRAQAAPLAETMAPMTTMTTILQAVLPLAALAFFLWMLATSRRDHGNDFIDPNNARQIGTLVGILRCRWLRGLHVPSAVSELVLPCRSR
ncbi:MAG: hypothetical protein WCJ31_14645 [Planctomycetia bacterium]